MLHISAKQLREKLTRHKIYVLDVRSADKFAQNHLEHANANMINIPKQEIFDDATDVPFLKDTEVVVTCTTGNSAKKCAKVLEDKGYKVKVLEGGMTAWTNEVKE